MRMSKVLLRSFANKKCEALIENIPAKRSNRLLKEYMIS